MLFVGIARVVFVERRKIFSKQYSSRLILPGLKVRREVVGSDDVCWGGWGDVCVRRRYTCF